MLFLFMHKSGNKFIGIDFKLIKAKMTTKMPIKTLLRCKMTHITLLAYENCSMSGITGVVDSFDIANKWNIAIDSTNKEKPPLFTWDIVSLDGKPVDSGNKIIINPTGSIHDIKSTDFVLIPGFLGPFNFRGKLPEEIIEWIKKWHKKEILVGSTCTGTFFLAETGLLDNKTATTNWLFANLFKKSYPRVNLKPEKMLTVDSGIICTGATTSFFNLCIYLIEKFGSAKLASYSSKSLLMDPARYSQAPYTIFQFQKDHSDQTILEAQTILEKNYRNQVSIDALASDLGISIRHFIRRFKKATGDSPLLYLQRIRIEDAKNKLETTVHSIDEITRMVGYEDVNSFRKLFKKHTALSPKEYRIKFARRA